MAPLVSLQRVICYRSILRGAVVRYGVIPRTLLTCCGFGLVQGWPRSDLGLGNLNSRTRAPQHRERSRQSSSCLSLMIINPCLDAPWT